MFSFVPRILVIPDIKPWPPIEPSAANAADVIGHEIFAKLVTFVRTHPKLVCPWTELNPDRIPNSPRENILPGDVGIEFKNPGAVRFGRIVGHIRKRSDRDIHFFAIWRERDVASPMAAAAE